MDDNVLFVDINVEIQDVVSIDISESEDIDMDIQDIIYASQPGGEGFDYYNGNYKVVPSSDKQILKTKNKAMKDDVTVLDIPVYEMSNDSGLTFVIGGTYGR